VDNIAIGYNSLKSVTTGGNNVALGWTTGFGLVGGSDNVMIGTSAGGNLATLDQSIYIGGNARGSATGVTNEVAIGYNIQGKGSNTVTLGNTSHTQLYIPPVIQTINGTNMVFSTSANSTISTTINGTTITTISTNGITLVNPASTLRTTGNKMALIATSSVNVESRLVVDSGVYTDSVRALPGGGGLLLGVLGATNSNLYCYDSGYVQANGYFQSVAGAFTSYNTALTISSANTGIIMKSAGTTIATIDTSGLVGVKPFQAFSFTASNAAWAFPTGAKALWIKLVGAGSGGSGGGYVARNVGTAGTATTMSGSGISPTLSGAGGLATGSYGGTAPIGTNGNIMNCYGSYGGAGMYAGPVTFNTYMAGGTGGSSPFGGGGGGGDVWYYSFGTPGYQGSGGGGGAAAMNTGQGPGMGGTGGGSGGYLEHYIANPSGTYNITIGVGGTGGASSGQGYAGGNGGNGFVVVYAYF